MKEEESKEVIIDASRIIGQFKDYIVVAIPSEVQVFNTNFLDAVLEKIPG